LCRNKNRGTSAFSCTRRSRHYVGGSRGVCGLLHCRRVLVRQLPGCHHQLPAGCAVSGVGFPDCLQPNATITAASRSGRYLRHAGSGRHAAGQDRHPCHLLQPQRPLPRLARYRVVHAVYPRARRRGRWKRGYLRMRTRYEPQSASIESLPRETRAAASTRVNDIHSQLNRTRVDQVLMPANLAELQAVIRWARAERKPVSVAGGRHAMGGQQFGTGALLVDLRKMSRVLSLDMDSGIMEVEAGALWPELIAEYLHRQKGRQRQWGLAQKQTGADRLSLGGTLAANAHGRGLSFKPFIGDLEAFTLVNAEGSVFRCSRRENPQLYSLAVGGYGLFGIVYSLRMRLMPRRKMERVVEIRTDD